MADKDHMNDLIASILKGADIVRERTEALKCPPINFDGGIPDILMKDEAMDMARRQIEHDATELATLMKGPERRWLYPPMGCHVAIHTIIRTGLITAIPADSDEGMTFEELAKRAKVSVSANLVKRLFRTAISWHIFKESPVGTVRHNASSRLIARESGCRDWILFHLEEFAPASLRVPDALDKWNASDHPTHTGFNLADNTDEPMFSFFRHHPGRAERINEALTWLASHSDIGNQHFTDAYPWTELPAKAKIVDIAGALGAMAMAIEKVAPGHEIVVQELPHVAEEGRQKLDPSLKNISFMDYDFFTPQPIKDADLYIIRYTLHDWNDKYAAKILNQTVNVMKPESRLLIIDHILPAPGEIHKSEENDARNWDMSLMAILNGKERDIDDFNELFGMTQKNLAITRSWNLPQAGFIIFELKVNT